MISNNGYRPITTRRVPSPSLARLSSSTQQEEGEQATFQHHRPPHPALSRYREITARKSRKSEPGTLDLNNVRLVSVSKDFTLGFLHDPKNAQFVSVPDFQRSTDCHPTSFAQFIVDTILRGWPIEAPRIYWDKYASPDNWYVLDGIQRLWSAFDFLDGKFRTMLPRTHERYDPNSVLTPIHPGKYFQQLPFALQNEFRAATIRYDVVYATSYVLFSDIKPLLARQFRLSQWHNRLTTGQQFHSHQGATREFADHLATHPFFRQLFPKYDHGKDAKLEKFTMALYVIAMNLWKFPIDLNKAIVDEVASGFYDEYIDDTFRERCEQLLTTIAHIFHNGSREPVVRAKLFFSSVSDIIPACQVCQFLEWSGFDLSASEQGCLSEWFYTAKWGMQPSYSEINRVGFSQFAKFQDMRTQHFFWNKYASLLPQQRGLVRVAEDGLVYDALPSSPTTTQLLLK